MVQFGGDGMDIFAGLLIVAGIFTLIILGVGHWEYGDNFKFWTWGSSSPSDTSTVIDTSISNNTSVGTSSSTSTGTSTSSTTDTTALPGDTTSTDYSNRLQVLENLVLNGKTPVAITEGFTSRYIRTCGQGGQFHCSNLPILVGGYTAPQQLWMSSKDPYNSSTKNEDRATALENAIFLGNTAIMIRVSSDTTGGYLRVCGGDAPCSWAKRVLGQNVSGTDIGGGFHIIVANYTTTPYNVPTDLGARVQNLEDAILNGKFKLIMMELIENQWITSCGQYINCPGCFCGDGSNDSNRCSRYQKDPSNLLSTIGKSSCAYELVYMVSGASIATASSQALNIYKFDGAPTKS